ncbi:Protein jagged-1 [Schistosoma japonicum]|nr:Protein jagged-1 [Schistosoma japonicum]
MIRLFSVILEAYDLVNHNEKYLIDRAIHRGLLRPLVSGKLLNSSSDWHQVTISTQYSGYTFCIQLTCELNHYGNDCTKVCRSNDNQTKFKCDSNGNKICEPGWSGIECNKAICNIGCHPVHGTCSRPGECDCSTGWQGPLCDECIKYPGCKHGTCNDAPFTCRCLPNWGGPFCDQDLDYCGRHQPCLNNGICKNLNSSYSKPFSCSCTRDFTGEYCEIRLAPCTVNPCKRGRCLSTDNITYECECQPGWRGDHCEENIDYCLTNTCLNGGTCQDLDGPGFQCLCPPGFKGSNCQLRSPCSNSQCVHAINCKQLIQPINGIEYECNCQPGWTGQFCDENIDDCVDKCENGGTCHDLLDDFYCTCPIGFEGRHCEINRECASKPCQNKGICHEIPGGYLCECPNGFIGQNCEISVNGCNPNLCQNGAYCYTLLNGFYCKCSEKFYGQFCEHPRPYCGPDGCDTLMDPCISMLMANNDTISSFSTSSFSLPSSSASSALTLIPSTMTHPRNLTQSNIDNLLVNHEITYPHGVCGQHGTCIGTENGEYQCVCGTGYQGKYCHQPINYCETMPCMHDATCVNGLEGYECICEEGFSGVQCEIPIDLCQPNPCQNGGYCQHTLHPGDFQCRCAPGWSGRWCEFQTDNPCNMAKICFNNGKCHQDPLSPGLFKCDCDNQWVGSVCQLRRPETRSCVQENLCKNGATCVDLGNSFNCICRPGFDGQYCENDINECNSMPCYNNGTCKDLINSFECDCPKGFTGADCRINVNECASYPCSFGATCIDRVGTYECICPEQRYGRHCEEVIIEIEPKPPACNFYGRIYDHNDNWTYNGEICHILSSGLNDECFVPPCYLRTICLNASRSISEQLQIILPNFHFQSALPGCRPNSLILNNHCARLLLRFSKLRMSYATTVEDICNAIKNLPSLKKYHQYDSRKLGIGISCDIKAGYSIEQQNTIEVTLSALNDHIRIGPRLLVPVVCAGILFLALICIFIICCYSQRKRRQLLMKYATTVAPNNESSNFIQYLSDNNNITTNYNLKRSTNQNDSRIYQSQLLKYDAPVQNREFQQLPSPSHILNVNGRRLLLHHNNNNNNNNITSGMFTLNTNRINVNKTNGSIII